jgi:hypothetical protein
VSDEFVRLLRRGLAKTGSQVALGRTLGVSKQRISSALAGVGYPFGVVNCLKLARLIDERDWVVLRAAGKAPIADMLERSYGDRPMRVGDPLEILTPTQRRHVLALVRDLAGIDRSP